MKPGLIVLFYFYEQLSSATKKCVFMTQGKREMRGFYFRNESFSGDYGTKWTVMFKYISSAIDKKAINVGHCRKCHINELYCKGTIILTACLLVFNEARFSNEYSSLEDFDICWKSCHKREMPVCGQLRSHRGVVIKKKFLNYCHMLARIECGERWEPCWDDEYYDDDDQTSVE